MKMKIAVLPGDGIGPEVSEAAVQVLRAVTQRFEHELTIDEARIGGCAIDADGDPLPGHTIEVCRQADAVFLGAVGGPQWSNPDAALRPEQGLLKLRKLLGVYGNLRPVRPHPGLHHISPLKTRLLKGVDLLVVRELTGGIYFGEKKRTADRAVDECVYTTAEIERIVVMACRLASARRGKLTSVDKANVLETSRLWRSVTTRVVAEQFPELELEHLLVDAASMHLLSRPADFDVIVTENMFGDILTDEASMLAGSLGLLPSASLADDGTGLYEPIHGSAPDIAGKGIANPLGAIGSVAMLLRHSFNLEAEAQAVESAIDVVIDAGVLTPDLAERHANTKTVTTAVIDAMANAVERDHRNHRNQAVSGATSAS